jgi:biotin operon repressor
LLKDISVRLGVHVNVVQRYVAEGRRRGDVRAEYRRKPGSSVPNLVLYLLQENGEVSWDDLRVSLWVVDEERPSTWRTIVRVAIGDLRKRGFVIESDRSIDGYRLVK